ncbi:Baeyer-Villiger monooxygenase [Zhongshania aliphaticivorans]|uniref:Baeyer-Villiger monooxygenase n=1 Tax=Zhongshania aliphaticivorans TaxID=1470434 RepID=A0A5S9P7P2_9GAMM|nr:NAD(P)/FAD-dependent oxidoreductase [Zhongshania aliphaticivorans]CAA0091918.1 Baeyer-Villiger monooxygenase [Zhongshania aliphaticivorans]CAA0099251.1 Baeyer-Villiger monooxygenase [Zhongshania aliphaticivorans]
MKELDVIILGAGMSGLCMAIELKKRGVNKLEIIEKNSDVGGTWFDNSYPGACCDVPSALYSFSFEANPNWSRIYSPQVEIQHYFQHCANKYDLMPHIRFNSEVISADYQQENGKWLVTLANGEQLLSRIVVSGLGQLNKPNTPELQDANEFKGVSFHSARWNHDIDLRGKHVAVIGSAASAIQLIPHVAQQAKKLYVYQRSANYILSRGDREYSATEKYLFHTLPWTQKLVRLYYYLRQEGLFYGAMLSGSLRSKLIKWLAKRNLRSTIHKQALRDVMTPDYPLGCKRVLVSDDFYQALNSDAIDMVTSPISGLNASGVISDDKISRPVDVILYATGFRATEFLVPLRVHGENGIELNQAWQQGAEAHRGVALNGFPNFYMLYGPNTNLGHSSIIYMVEKQSRYIAQCIKHTFDNELRSLQPHASAQAAFNKRLQDALSETVWGEDCGSWYKNDSGKITNNWPYTTWRFGQEMKTVAFKEYQQET